MLIGPTEIAPEVMKLIKKIEERQKGILLEVQTCKNQYKSLEHLRLDQIKEELDKYEKKLKQ